LTPTSVSFTRVGGDDADDSPAGGFNVYKDVSGSAPLITNPVWTTANPDAGRVGYACANTIMMLKATFTINPVPTSNTYNVTIEGDVPGFGVVRKTNVTLLAGQSSVPVRGITANQAFACTTKYFNPMTINWRHMADGAQCPACVADGSTATPVYVTQGTPTQPKVFLSTLHFAVSNDGASDPGTAINRSWSLFVGPAHIRTWDDRPLHYYHPDVLPESESCAASEERLLTVNEGSGECGAFAELLQAVFATNNIGSEIVTVSVVGDAHLMLIQSWTRNQESPDPPTPEYKWKLVLDPAAVAMDDLRVQPNVMYGDLTNLDTLHGQNTEPPSVKMFQRHYIVKPTPPQEPEPWYQNLEAWYYDPSYGIRYQGLEHCTAAAPCEASRDFEQRVLEGYIKLFEDDEDHEFRVRDPAGVSWIRFGG